MARVYGLKTQLAKNGIDEPTIKAIIGNGDLVDVTTRMESLLDADTMQRALDACGCSGGSAFIAHCKKIGKALAGQSLSEKIDHLNNNVFRTEHIALEGDGLLRGTLVFEENGKHRCVCSAVIKKGLIVADLTGDADARVMPLAYCYCCAGSFRRHLQLQLGVELRTREIISSPIHSKGEQPCAFVFALME